MERLYIVRHGIAMDYGTPGVADDERPLVPRGIKRFGQVARGLREMGVEVDRIVTSPLPRARETAEILARTLDVWSRLGEDRALTAGRSAEEVAGWLEGREEDRLAIVGHNPWCSDLVELLLTGGTGRGAFELKKGGVAALRGGEDGGWKLDWLAPPGLLRRVR